MGDNRYTISDNKVKTPLPDILNTLMQPIAPYPAVARIEENGYMPCEAGFNHPYALQDFALRVNK